MNSRKEKILLKHVNPFSLFLGKILCPLLCKYWFRRFKDGDFDVIDYPHSETSQKLETNSLEALLDENPSQT